MFVTILERKTGGGTKSFAGFLTPPGNIDMPQDRVMMFIDGSNLFHSAHDLGIRIDYTRLKEELVGERKLIRPYIYVTKGKHGGQNAFYNKLRYLGYEVIEHELRQYGNEKPFEKGVDISLTTGLLLYGHKNLYDTAIVLTGDKDFKAAIKAVKEMGKIVEIAGFDHSTAKELQLIADKYISLDKLIDKIKMD
jgi:uncharacterized LabA/DUF88 family protein